MNECSLLKMKRNVSQVVQKPVNWEFKRFSLPGEKNYRVFINAA